MKETLKTWIDERECKWAQTRTLRICCYRYAPEQFHAWYRESKGWKLISAIDHDSTLGGMLICGNPEQCIQELKRMVRQEAKGGNGVTYGFFFADSRREYAFFRELCTFDLSLTSRLRLYKEIKREMEKNSWSDVSSRTATLGENYRIENVEDNARVIDPSRPCSIRVADRYQYRFRQ